MNRFLDVFGDMLGNAKEEVLRELERSFPGVTAESLKRGWIPVPQSALERQLRRETRGLAWVKAISLKCVPESFRIQADTDRYLLKHRTRLVVQCEQFAIGQDSKVAVFSCNDPIAVEGRNFLGRISAWLARGIVLNALKTGTVGKRVGAVSEGALELDWPKITVHLDKIDPLESVLRHQLLGYTLTDFLSFGPLRIEEEHVQLKVGIRAGLLGDSGFVGQLGQQLRQRLRRGRSGQPPREDEQA